MKLFLALLKLSFQSMLFSSSGGGRKKRRRAASGVGTLVVIALVGVYLSCYFSWMFLAALAPIGRADLVFTLLGIAALLMGLLLSTTAVRSTVYGGKDNDLLLSLPVSSTMLMAGRVLAVYLENLLFSFFLLLPAGVMCALMGQGALAGSVGFWLRLLLAVVAFPLLDTALSVVLGAFVAWLSTRISKKAIGQNIVMGLYLAAVFYFSFNLNSIMQDLIQHADAVTEGLRWAMPMLWLGSGIVGSWPDLLLFVLCCAVPFGLMVYILGKLYRKAVTAFTAQAARSDYRLSGQRSAGQVKALLAKEAKRFFGTPAYFWNTGLGFLMAVALGVAALFQQSLCRELLALLGEAGTFAAACGVLGFCLSTGAVAAFSVSLEGQNLWILREAPIPTGRLLRIKTGFQGLVALPCVLICAVCLAIALGAGVPFALGLMLFSLLFEVGSACFGMLMGLTFPRLDAASDAAVVKQSMLSFLAIFVPMFALIALGALWGVCLLFIGQLAATVIAMAVLAALSALLLLLLVRKGAGMFRRLSE